MTGSAPRSWRRHGCGGATRSDPGQRPCAGDHPGAGGSDFEPVGSVTLKGLPEPVLASSVRWDVAAFATSARSARHVQAVRVRRPGSRDGDAVRQLVPVAGGHGEPRAGVGRSRVGKARLVAELAGRVHAADGARCSTDVATRSWACPTSRSSTPSERWSPAAPPTSCATSSARRGRITVELVPAVAERLRWAAPTTTTTRPRPAATACSRRSALC